MNCRTIKMCSYYSVPDNNCCNDCLYLNCGWALVKEGKEYACDTFRNVYNCKIFNSKDLKCEGEKIQKCKQCLNLVSIAPNKGGSRE